MEISNSKVKNLIEFYKQIVLLSQVSAVLEWDMSVNLPEKAVEDRAAQSAVMTSLIVDKWLDKGFVQLLQQAKLERNLNNQEQAVIRNIEHEGKIYFKVPKDLIIEKSRTTSEAFMSWQKAKQENKFVDFLPYLEKLVEIDRSIASHLGKFANPYDALLDLYEPGLTSHELDDLFGRLQPALVKLLKEIQASKLYKSFDQEALLGLDYPLAAQKQLVEFILKKMGYDFAAGRIDIATHPFETTLGSFDNRITTWYKNVDFRESLFASMHEGGHALYEQGINPDFAMTPLSGGVSLGIHESQSRFWENIVGRNPAFISFITPILQAFYPEQLGKVEEEDLVRLMNMVKPSFIRVQADEVTYNLHIILRYHLEKKLINGEITPNDLPKLWKEKMKELLGIFPETDREGVLQDVHWSWGTFGYFPTYTLGNLYAAQFYNSLKKELDLDELVRNGDLGTILSWLRSNIHKPGKLYWPKELVKNVTGEALNSQYFIDYLNNKYRKVYNF